MPTYKYACRDCDSQFEAMQSFHDAALAECGACGGRLRKVFTPAGIIFKGSGYYTTDYRPQPAAESGDGQDSSAKSDGGGGEHAEGSEAASSSEAGGSSENGSSSGEGDSSGAGSEGGGGQSQSTSGQAEST
jgi:putative FmdB family regulatory protein